MTDIDVLEIAKAQNFNMELFNQYQEYQKNMRSEYPRKYSHEELATLVKSSNPDLDCFDPCLLEWFANYSGFRDYHSLPDCLSFLRYCARRDIYAYNDEPTEVLSRK